jgi:hypothetical protein
VAKQIFKAAAYPASMQDRFVFAGFAALAFAVDMYGFDGRYMHAFSRVLARIIIHFGLY